MPINKYATAYINDAYSRMLAALLATSPPAFNLYPQPEDFEAALDHAKSVASAMDEYFHSLAQECAANSNSTFSTTRETALVSSALHDADLFGEIESAADAVTEAEEWAR